MIDFNPNNMNYRTIVNKYILNPIKIILELIYGSVKVIFFLIQFIEIYQYDY